MNTLYYGDNLDVLRRHVDDASMCVVYLDPWCSTNCSTLTVTVALFAWLMLPA